MTPPPRHRLLVVSGPRKELDGRDTAGAVFEERAGKWLCVRAAPVLSWMLEDPVHVVEATLKGFLSRERRWSWAWAPVYRI